EKWFAPFKSGEMPDMGALASAHFGHLPVWVKGNAYFNGATVCKHEKEKFVDKEHAVTVQIIEKDGKYTLKTNLYSFLKDYRCGIITSDILGCAFEPEQRFESPDGSEIIFDRDYNGEHRGLSALPGPFVDEKSAKKVLFSD
ncbi:MAG: hypothetical protein IK096_07605, partial [Lachnospiraceae bacterium]|nr:hypothetical protein [Lachnospiraceae bacterium]